MRRTFISDYHQESFEKLGYIIIPGFLNNTEIDYLKSQYLNQDNDLGKGFHASMHSKNIEYRRKVSSIISEIFTPKAHQYLLNYRPLVSNFTVKEPGKESFFDFHLDWNMVDETVCRSITIWTPLQDTNKENGYLWILESSNTLGNSYRCGPGLILYFETKQELKKRKFKKKALSMKAGDAIIYDHKLFHGSPPNLSKTTRIAINQAMCPADFPSLHYIADSQGNITVKEVDDDYYCRCIINQNDSEGNVVKTFRLSSDPVLQKEVNNLFKYSLISIFK